MGPNFYFSFFKYGSTECRAPQLVTKWIFDCLRTVSKLLGEMISFFLFLPWFLLFCFFAVLLFCSMFCSFCFCFFCFFAFFFVLFFAVLFSLFRLFFFASCFLVFSLRFGVQYSPVVETESEWIFGWLYTESK